MSDAQMPPNTSRRERALKGSHAGTAYLRAPNYGTFANSVITAYEAALAADLEAITHALCQAADRYERQGVVEASTGINVALDALTEAFGPLLASTQEAAR